MQEGACGSHEGWEKGKMYGSNHENQWRRHGSWLSVWGTGGSMEEAVKVVFDGQDDGREWFDVGKGS